MAPEGGFGDALPVTAHMTLLQVAVAESNLACVAGEGMGSTVIHRCGVFCKGIPTARDSCHGFRWHFIPAVFVIDRCDFVVRGIV